MKCSWLNVVRLKPFSIKQMKGFHDISGLVACHTVTKPELLLSTSSARALNLAMLIKFEDFIKNFSI
jgi:hypothetical protein